MAANATNYFPITPGQPWANKLKAFRDQLAATIAAGVELAGKMGQIASDDNTYVEMEQACGLTTNGQTGTGVSVGYKVNSQLQTTVTDLQAAAIIQFRDQIG